MIISCSCILSVQATLGGSCPQEPMWDLRTEVCLRRILKSARQGHHPSEQVRRMVKIYGNILEEWENSRHHCKSSSKKALNKLIEKASLSNIVRRLTLHTTSYGPLMILNNSRHSFRRKYSPKQDLKASDAYWEWQYPRIHVWGQMKFIISHLSCLLRRYWIKYRNITKYLSNNESASLIWSKQSIQILLLPLSWYSGIETLQPVQILRVETWLPR